MNTLLGRKIEDQPSPLYYEKSKDLLLCEVQHGVRIFGKTQSRSSVAASGWLGTTKNSILVMKHGMIDEDTDGMVMQIL